MRLTIYFPLKTWLVWLATVAFFFILIFPQFSNFTARAQVSEALSLISTAKSILIDFYETHQRCPHSNAEIRGFSKRGRYVTDISFVSITGSDACYIVAEMANTSLVDRRIRGSKLALEVKLPSQWVAQANCITDIKQPVADCQFKQWADL